MKSHFKKLPGSTIVLEVSLDHNEFLPYWQRAFDAACSQVHLKGFRPGAAPKEFAGKAVDREKVFEYAVEEAARKTLQNVAQENEWSIIDRPRIEVFPVPAAETGTATEHQQGATGLKFKATLVVFPEIELGNYKKIAHKTLGEKRKIEVETQEVEKTLDWVRQSRASLTRATHGAQNGNVIEVDVESFCEGKAIPGAALKEDRFVVGESRFVPGFDAAIAGHKEGDEARFSLTAPADYWQKDLQNKKIDFRVKVRAVFDRRIPELNDGFVQGLGRNFQTVDDVRKNIREGLAIEKEEKERERVRAKMVEEIVKRARIDVPQIMIEKTLDGLVREVKASLGAAVANHSDEELRKQLYERAVERVCANLVMYRIAKLEHLEPTPEEVEAEAKERKLDLERDYDYSYGIVQNKKVFALLERQ